MGNPKRSGRRVGHKKVSLFKARGAAGTLAIAPGRESLCVGTLSFSEDPEADGDWQLRPQTLLQVLSHATKSARLPRPDIVVVAGRTLRATPRADDVLLASGGVPVLFESLNGGGYRFASRVSGKAALVTLRERQLVIDHEDARATTRRQRRLVELISDGVGVVHVGGINLVLFVCGENNAVDQANDASVMQGGQRRDLSVLKGRWIMINPAHTPYRKAMGGIVKVAKDGWGHGPTLGLLAARVAPFRDGTRPPLAVVHCNNFDSAPAHPTRARAHVAFDGESVASPPTFTSDGATPTPWLHARYTIALR